MTSATSNPSWWQTTANVVGTPAVTFVAYLVYLQNERVKK